MSLYKDAAAILSSPLSSDGSLRSRVYDSNGRVQSSPQLVYALITECAKWDVILSEVIENAGILSQEPKLSPLLALLLTHDHLLSKRGIACPQNHPLRLAVERHKARLAAELTRARLRRRCATLEALRLHLLGRKIGTLEGGLQARWVRINNLKTTFVEELETLFESFTEFPALDQLVTNCGGTKGFVWDPNIPHLAAINVSTKEITNTRSYKAGKIILQDKASCFPAHLLLESRPRVRSHEEDTGYGDILDACAAPGNKTSHIASILAASGEALPGFTCSRRIIYACERDAKRSDTLQEMLDRAGANGIVKALTKQDFLALNPHDIRFKNVTHILLDPSCSGSGILKREDVPSLILPKDPRDIKGERPTASNKNGSRSGGKIGVRKRKRETVSPEIVSEADLANQPATPPALDTERLQKLSNLQTRLLEHAFTFPMARIVTYSTCSIHALENEMVALRALNSAIARKRMWRVMRRDEQPEGLRIWPHRGEDWDEDDSVRQVVKETCLSKMKDEDRREFRQACIRCLPGGVDGTMGFFVVGFVRDPDPGNSPSGETAVGGKGDDEDQATESDGWEGFSADGDQGLIHSD